MTVLAVDLGTKTGWAVGSKDLAAPIRSGVHRLPAPPPASKGMRWAAFRAFLTEMKATCPDLVGVWYERSGGTWRNGAAMADHYGLIATLQSWSWHHQIPLYPVSPATLKKRVTGSGRATKSAVVEAVRALGYSPTDDNEADAIALVLIATRPRLAPPASTTELFRPTPPATPSTEAA